MDARERQLPGVCRKPLWKVPDVAQATCAACEEGFTPRNSQQTYCSPKCKNLGGSRLRRLRNAARAERTCYRCKAVKSSDQFPSASSPYCRPCSNWAAREWRAANPERVATLKRRSIAKAAERDPDYHRKLTLRKFGLSLDSYGALLDGQGGRCAICRTAQPGGRHGTWHVDHDRSCCPATRSCGRCVRGLLCQNCNILLGHAKDNVGVLVQATEYLNKHAKP